MRGKEDCLAAVSISICGMKVIASILTCCQMERLTSPPVSHHSKSVFSSSLSSPPPLILPPISPSSRLITSPVSSEGTGLCTVNGTSPRDNVCSGQLVNSISERIMDVASDLDSEFERGSKDDLDEDLGEERLTFASDNVGKIHKPVLSEANGLVEVHCFKGREWN